MFHRNIEEEELSPKKSKCLNNDLINNFKLGKDIINVSRANQRPFNHIFVWYRTINEQIRSMMQSGSTQQKLLIVMDNYIRSLKANSNTFIRNANRCFLLAKTISCSLFLFKNINRTSTETHEYLLKICELLSFYTFLELKYSSKFNSSKLIIAERISSNYDIHLKDVDIFYTLRVFLCIPTLFNEKEIMSKIFQKYLNRHHHIFQMEIPDTLYCMYLIAYSKWISLENDYYKRIKICESANKNIKPMESLCLNKFYAPFLPVYMHTDSDATKYILSNRINIKLLTKVLKNDACRNENIILIDLSHSDTTNAPTILNDNDTHWINISSSDQKSSSVKLESPIIIDAIDLTEEQPSSWEFSWLNELLRKSRASITPIALNIFAPKLVGTIEIIDIQDDDNCCIALNDERVQALSFDSTECEDSLNSVDRTKLVGENISILENNIIEDNCVFNESVSFTRKLNIPQHTAEKAKIPSEITAKRFQKDIQLLDTNAINIKRNIKTYERKKMYEDFCTLVANDFYSAEYDKNIDYRILQEKKIETGMKLPVNESNSSIILKTSYDYDSFRPNTRIPNNIENRKSAISISTNEVNVEDINSPPVECFSESDADELVQLIDKNTKESNATNLFCSLEKEISAIPKSHTVTVSNSNIRKVSFAKLPEKHTAASRHFSIKNIRNVDKPHFTKKSTKVSPINKSLIISDSNINQPEVIRNNLETSSQSSLVQELGSSSDWKPSPIEEINRSNKVSGTIGSLFMMKFPQPTYHKHENLITFGCEELRTDLNKSKKHIVNKKYDNKQYVIDKKQMSDFDKYLEKLKEKRSKTTHIKWIHKKKPQSHNNASVQKNNYKQINYNKLFKKNVLQLVDEKLKKNSYVEIERSDFSLYVTSKLNKLDIIKENRHRQLSPSANPYVRIKRIKNLKGNVINDIEYTDKIQQNVLSRIVETTSKILPSIKNISAINSTFTNTHNNIRIQNLKDTKNVNNMKNSKKNPISLKTCKHFKLHHEKFEKIVTSESTNHTMTQNILKSVVGHAENVFINKVCKLKDPENEVSSTQDHVDILEECKISSTQDISNSKKERNNSVQNNEIDTSQKIFCETDKLNFLAQVSENIYFNNEQNIPTTTTDITRKKRFNLKKKQVLSRKKTKTQKKKHNNQSKDFNYTKIVSSQGLETKKYFSENSTIAKTYSIHNLVSNVFVPSEVENFFDNLN